MKKILLTLASLFLLYQSVGLVQLTTELSSGLVWWGDLLLGAAFCLFVTGVFAFAGFAWPTERLLPATYYVIRRPARLKKWYRRLGVEGFRRMLLATFWRNPERRSSFYDGTRAGLRQMARSARKAEFGHLWPFIILTVLALIYATKGFWLLGATMLAINVVFNGYPILLQRNHRRRLAVMERLRERKG